jgi:hypothetical protein
VTADNTNTPRRADGAVPALVLRLARSGSMDTRKAAAEEIMRLRKALKTIRDVACGERQCKSVAVCALAENAALTGGEAVPCTGLFAGGSSMNAWPGGRRHAMSQSENEAWNARNFPGTRQLCERCGEPTERCEDDSLYSDEDRQIGPLCVECWNTANTNMVTPAKNPLDASARNG